MLGPLRRIISIHDQPVENHESNEMAKVVKEVCEQNVELFRKISNIQTSLPAQVDDQKPVYFLDACGFQARIDLTWINCWEAFYAVLRVQFKQRGLKIVERKQFVLEDAHTTMSVDTHRRFELCFIPGRKINMDACLDEKEHVGNCCPICRYSEPTTVSDQAVDW